MSTLRARIEEAMRRRPDLSQADIARACGVKTPSVSDWLNGKTKSLRPEVSRRGSILFGCDQNWLATGVGTPNWADISTAPTLAPAGPSLAEALPVVFAALAQIPRAQRAALHAEWAALLVAPDSSEVREAITAALTPSKLDLSKAIGVMREPARLKPDEGSDAPNFKPAQASTPRGVAPRES